MQQTDRTSALEVGGLLGSGSGSLVKSSHVNSFDTFQLCWQNTISSFGMFRADRGQEKNQGTFGQRDQLYLELYPCEHQVLHGACTNTMVLLQSKGTSPRIYKPIVESESGFLGVDLVSELTSTHFIFISPKRG